MFTRGAGQNSKYKMANDAPYDGGSIGAYLGDAIRNISGNIYSIATLSYGAYGAMQHETISGTPLGISQTNGGLESIQFNASFVVPTALENRPASVSAYLCIKY
jgi:hypothetical protein